MLLLALYACVGDVIQHTDSAEPDDTDGLAITALDPESGPAAGGTFLRIAGAGFTTASAVTVGGAACAELTFLSAGELYCTTPPGAVGVTEVRVADGEAEGTAPFTYLADEPDTGDTGEILPTITGCTLDAPTSMTVEAEDSTAEVTGSVTIPGRTETEGEPVGVEAQVGYGAAGSEPSTWSWEEMSWSVQAGAADQYSGSFEADREGTYDYTVRFRAERQEWVVCTAGDGSYGSVEVTAPTDEEPVEYCHLQWPCALTVAPGATSEAVYAWIYQGGVTQGAGQGAHIEMELGVGVAGSDPLLGWNWSLMSYFTDKDGMIEGDMANDEYRGTFVGPAVAGTYDYAVRASADSGLTWTLCDLGGDSCNQGGSTDGYDDPGVCTVE